MSTTGSTTETTDLGDHEASGLDQQQAKMLEKIRGLLKQAEHKNTGLVEAELFTAKAAELMHKYRIDRAMIELGKSKVVDLGTVLRRGVKITAPYAKESTALLSVVAGHLNCRVILETTEWRSGVWAAVFGIDSDPELVEMLFTSLRIQATHGMLAAGTGRPGEDLATFRSSWMQGFTTSLHQRFARMRYEAKCAEANVRTGPAEIALRDRMTTVDDHVDRLYPRLETIKGNGVNAGSGREQGYSAGQVADIGTGSVGGTTPRRTRALPA